MSTLSSDTGRIPQDSGQARPRARERLIVALDVPSLNEAAALVDALIPIVDWFKVGSELYTAAGPDAVQMVLHRGGKVFLDLKYHDIPNTVARAVAAAAALGVTMLDVHIAGGLDMLGAAVEAAGPRRHRSRPLILGVTLLTSDPDPEAGAIVLERARTARQAGLDGVVASAHEAAAVKAVCGRDFVVVTPGIRPHTTAHPTRAARAASAPADDQRRTVSPSEAAAAGSDFLVVGRPITHAPDPGAAAAAVLEEIERAAR